MRLQRSSGMIAVSALIAASAAITSAGECVPVLDQQHDGPSYGVGSIIPLAQTFTVGMTGTLTSVEMRANTFVPGTPVLFEIHATVGGLPDDSVTLGARSVVVPGDISGLGDFTSIDFRADNIPVTAGELLAIVAYPPGSQLNLNSTSPANSTYTGGRALGRASGTMAWTIDFNLDFDFRTFVAPCAAACPCELTGDSPSAVDIGDLLTYLGLWFTNDPAAEQTGDNPAIIEVQDLLTFLACWFPASSGAACP